MPNFKRMILLSMVLAMLAAFAPGSALAQEDQPAAEQPAMQEAPAADQPALQEAPAADAPAEGGQEAGQAPADGEGDVPQQRPKTLFDNPMFLVVMFGGLALLWFWSSRSRKKQQQKRQEMLAGLSKGDKVTSIGGIVGTVIEVRDDEVTVKVDETNNVRMKFARWAIRGVGEAAKTETPEDSK